MDAVFLTQIGYPALLGGTGGLTSALYFARAGMSVMVIEGREPGGALGQSFDVQNWP